MRNQHMKPPKYNCPPCNQIFEKYMGFYMHVRKFHPNWQGIDYDSFRVDWELIFMLEFPLECPHFLDVPDEDLETLMSTKVRHCDFGFACLLCGSSIKEKKNMRTHMRDRHMKPRQYRCDPCNQIFLNRAFYKHISKHHPNWHGIDFESFRVYWRLIHPRFILLSGNWNFVVTISRARVRPLKYVLACLLMYELDNFWPFQVIL